jgi:hypothetical protein
LSLFCFSLSACHGHAFHPELSEPICECESARVVERLLSKQRRVKGTLAVAILGGGIAEYQQRLKPI